MLRTLTTEEIKILNILEQNSDLSIRNIAEKTNLEEAAAGVIIKKLSDEGIIIKYKAIINWEKIESPGVIAIIQVNVVPQKGSGYDQVAKKISELDEVLTCMLVSGSFDLLIEVEGPSLKDVAFFVADKLATIDGVEHTKTNFLLRRYKQGGDIFSGSGKTHRLPVMV